MKIKCLSIKNPYSYLICAGIKDVENRSWKTDYRGYIYIHSSGQYAFDELPEKYFPDALELNKIIYSDSIDGVHAVAKIDKKAKYKKQLQSIINLIGYANDFNDKNNEPFFKNKSIIGKIDLVDIIQNSKSPWADSGSYHWILKNPVLFEKPVKHIKGKLKFFDYNINVSSLKILKI